MKLDWVNPGWQSPGFAGRLFPESKSEVFVLDNRRLTEIFDREEQIEDLEKAMHLVVAAALLINCARSPLASMGVLLLMASALIRAIVCLVLHAGRRRKRYDNALEDFLTVDRQWIFLRMDLLIVTMNLAMGPVMVGWALSVMSFGSSVTQLILVILGAVALCAAIQALHHQKVMRPLRARRQGVDYRTALCEARAA